MSLSASASLQSRNSFPGPSARCSAHQLPHVLFPRATSRATRFGSSLVNSRRMRFLVATGGEQMKLSDNPISYYNEARTHLSLAKDAPISRSIERLWSDPCRAMIGGLHHRYARI
jgi:hypothetical protein